MKPAAKAPSTISKSKTAETAVRPMSSRFTERMTICVLVLALATMNRCT